MARLEFFFDYSSPWTYMAFCRIAAVAAETGADLVWRPFYVAGAFRQANPGVAAMRAHPVPAKITHYYKDMRDCARRLGITIGRPPVYGGGSKPLNSARALRGAFIALEQDRISVYSRAMFEAYWRDLRDISDETVLADIVAALGFDAAAFLQATNKDDLKTKLRANTDDLVDRGGFGTPTFFVNGNDMYFGNDRLDFVREALEASKCLVTPRAEPVT